MKYLVMITLWIVIIVFSQENYIVPSICSSIHLVGLIGSDIEDYAKKLIEVKKQEAEKTRRVLEAIGLDLINALNKNK